MSVIEGTFNAQELKIACVVARFNDFITGKLLEGAKDCFRRHGGDEDQLDTVYVPGCFEIPLAAKKLAESKKYDAIISLGAVIRGATTHYDLVAGEAAKGIGSVSLETDTPVIFGVITTENIEQAIERAGTKAGNKGWEATLVAIEMANLIRKISE